MTFFLFPSSALYPSRQELKKYLFSFAIAIAVAGHLLLLLLLGLLAMWAVTTNSCVCLVLAIGRGKAVFLWMSAEMKWITAMAGEAKHGYVQLSPEVPLWVSFSGETGLVNVQIQRTTDVKAAEAVAQAKADECRVALSPSIVLTARHGTKNERMDYLHSLKILPEDSHVPAGYRKLGRINPEALTDKMVLLVSTIGSIIKIQNQEPKPGDKLDIL